MPNTSFLASKSFWVSAAERMVKSFAQTALVLWPVGDDLLHLYDIDWKTALLTAGMAAVASVLTSVVSGPIGPDGSPSLVGEPPKEPAAIVGDEAAPDTQPFDVAKDAAGDHELDGEGRDGAPEIPASLFEKPAATKFDDQQG